MKKILVAVTIILMCISAHAESGSFQVKGDIDKYYPVVFSDGNCYLNSATELELGRYNVHTDASWRGALIARFRYHTTNWGNGANFIDADIRANNTTAVAINNFIAGWKDVTSQNGLAKIIIWLRGGTTTYYYKANATVAPVVYDGVQNPLPYEEKNGTTLNTYATDTYKTSVDSYVNQIGPTFANNLYVNGTGRFNTDIRLGQPNDYKNIYVPFGSSTGGYNIDFQTYRDIYPDQIGARIRGERINNWAPNNALVQGIDLVFSTSDGSSQSALAERLRITNKGDVGIGTTDPKGYKLAVNGAAVFTKAVVKNYANWPDYVFDSAYNLPPLESVSSFIKNNKHLPEMPSASSIAAEGHDIGEVQKLLLKKVEELTLYIINQDSSIKSLKEENEALKKLFEKSGYKDQNGK